MAVNQNLVSAFLLSFTSFSINLVHFSSRWLLLLLSTILVYYIVILPYYVCRCMCSGKPTCYTLPVTLNGFPKFAFEFETVLMLAWLTVAVSHPFKFRVDCQLLPLLPWLYSSVLTVDCQLLPLLPLLFPQSTQLMVWCPRLRGFVIAGRR